MNVKGFMQASETLRLYHRINNNDFSFGSEFNERNIIEKLYVDLLPNNGVFNQIISKNTTFLVGRRGTGKSTVFAFAQSHIHKKKKIYQSILMQNPYMNCQKLRI